MTEIKSRNKRLKDIALSLSKVGREPYRTENSFTKDFVNGKSIEQLDELRKDIKFISTEQANLFNTGKASPNFPFDNYIPISLGTVSLELEKINNTIKDKFNFNIIESTNNEIGSDGYVLITDKNNNKVGKRNFIENKNTIFLGNVVMDKEHPNFEILSDDFDRGSINAISDFSQFNHENNWNENHVIFKNYEKGEQRGSVIVTDKELGSISLDFSLTKEKGVVLDKNINFEDEMCLINKNNLLQFSKDNTDKILTFGVLNMLSNKEQKQNAFKNTHNKIKSEKSQNQSKNNGIKL